MQHVFHTSNQHLAGLISKAGRVATVAAGTVLLTISGASAATPRSADPTAAATGFFEWLTENLTMMIGGGATVIAIGLIAAKALGMRIENDTLYKVIFYMLLIGWVPAGIDLLMAGWGTAGGK